MKKFKLGNKYVGQGHSPFIIAEMSGNHNQSLQRALEIVEAAARAGVDALKLQTYTADTMTLNLREGEFFLQNSDTLWQGKSLYELYQEAYTPWDWHEAIFNRCSELGIIAFSTPFDVTSVEFLESLNVPCYKIASFENTDIPLIEKVAATGKPIIMSTGMATLSELEYSVKSARAAGCKDLVLLKCTSSYPASPLNSNVVTIPHMQQLFDCQVGLSDHTLGIGVAIAATAFGATVIEKHFTLNRSDGGVDSAFSLEPSEMKLLVEESQRAWQGLGSVTYGPVKGEASMLPYRRSLYAVEDIEKGTPLTNENVRSIRPGRGLAPKYLKTILGKKARCIIKRGTPLAWNLFE